MSITVEADAPLTDLTHMAEQAYDLGSTSPSVTIRGQAGHPVVIDPEVAPPPKWELEIRPGERDRIASTLAAMTEVAGVDGATGVVVIDGWPSVTVERMDRFAEVFADVSATSLFRGGGTYTLQSLDEHLRIVHVPTRTSDEAILEIIDIAAEHPDAEVLLEAMTTTPQVPTLYISRLTPEEVDAVDERLRDPRLAGADVDGYPVEYVLGSLGETGVTYVNGTFGGVEG